MTKVVLAPPQQQTPAPVNPSAPISEITEPTAGKLPNPDVKQSIAQIRSAISPDQLDPQIAMIRTNLPSDISKDPQDTIDFLVHALASLSVQLNHERNFRMIYGTQLQLLLNLNMPGGLDRATVLAAYKEAEKAFPSMYPSPTAFDQWIAFLTNAGLVVIDPNERYQLTPVGRGLLRYIVDAKLPTQRPY